LPNCFKVINRARNHAAVSQSGGCLMVSRRVMRAATPPKRPIPTQNLHSLTAASRSRAWLADPGACDGINTECGNVRFSHKPSRSLLFLKDSVLRFTAIRCNVLFSLAIFPSGVDAVNRAEEHEALAELIRRSASLFEYYAQHEETRAIVRDLRSAMDRAIDRLGLSMPPRAVRDLDEPFERSRRRYSQLDK